MSSKSFKLVLSSLAAVLALSGSNLAQAQTSHGDVFTFMNADGTPAAGDVVGSATLHRSHDGVRLHASTTWLNAGSAYSVWWIIFNNPDACGDDGCTDADFGNPAVEASVLNATGRIAGGDGSATFSAFLGVGQIHTNPASGTLRHPFGPGLQDVRRAEIHVVIRSHGPATGNPEQISTLFADCFADDGMGGMVCFDPQAIVFPRPRRK
jgi:hypothetical protein